MLDYSLRLAIIQTGEIATVENIKFMDSFVRGHSEVGTLDRILTL